MQGGRCEPQALHWTKTALAHGFLKKLRSQRYRIVLLGISTFGRKMGLSTTKRPMIGQIFCLTGDVSVCTIIY
jgi:hypothetical protein